MVLANSICKCLYAFGACLVASRQVQELIKSALKFLLFLSKMLTIGSSYSVAFCMPCS